MEKPHFFQGHWIDDAELEARLKNLGILVAAAAPLESEVVLEAADRLGHQLANSASAEFKRLRKCLVDAQLASPSEIEAGLQEVAALLRRENLGQKLRRELGTTDPRLLSRVAYDDDVFEAWTPLGLLVHISPQNSFATGPLSVLEGLLTGNMNVLKTGTKESLFPQLFLEALTKADPGATLRERIIVARIPSRQTSLLSEIFAASDGIAVWGGEETVENIRKLAPPHVRLVEWGHRISLIYLSATSAPIDEVIERTAEECCVLDQQSCASPQCIYVETQSGKELRDFADRLAVAMQRVSPRFPALAADDREAAEITVVTECHRLETSHGQAKLIEGPKKDWRIFVDERDALVASPLFRSVWVKPLPREKIVSVLRPMRRYLQTAGLACGLNDLAELSRLLLSAGVTRVRKVGEMQPSYAGEPHDGLYALQRYSRRISVQAPTAARGISTFDELRTLPAAPGLQSELVTPKENFSATSDGAQLYFKSGGSSGAPKLSTFSYRQYDTDMWLGAEGLYAAGLDPTRDRAMNLFFSGGLYGGFLSIFSALERLKVVQFPMAAHPELEMVTRVIIDQGVNTLLGMPSYLMNLFEKNATAFEKYRRIEKIFYGGEHFTAAQRKRLTERFGVRLIRSGAYGSVDIGPMGYQCEYCAEGVHHLQQRLHTLEILKIDTDEPVVGDEAGRLVFTPRSVTSNKPRRYAIGDVGQWMLEAQGACPCGRSAPRFRLLGRTGDVFRIGSFFLNFRKFTDILSNIAGYAGDLQIQLDEAGLKERLTLRVSRGQGLTAETARQLCLDHYGDLHEAVTVDGTLVFEVEELSPEEFKRSPSSGKLLGIVDARKRA